jgi:hypothetical protein
MRQVLFCSVAKASDPANRSAMKKFLELLVACGFPQGA